MTDWENEDPQNRRDANEFMANAYQYNARFQFGCATKEKAKDIDRLHTRPIKINNNINYLIPGFNPTDAGKYAGLHTLAQIHTLT